MAQPVSDSRLFILKKDDNYGLGRTCMVKSWKVLAPANVGVRIVINNTELKLDNTDEKSDLLDGIFFDMEKIRKALRDIIPMTPDENELALIESSMFSAQLTAISHYNSFPARYLDNFFFSGTLYTYFIPFDLRTGEKVFPKQIDIEEVYIKTKQALEFDTKYENKNLSTKKMLKLELD